MNNHQFSIFKIFPDLKVLYFLIFRAFYKMLIEPDTPTYQDNLLSPHQNGDPLSPAPMKRPSSWARSSPLFPAGSRSRKFSFEKFRRAKSDTDNSNCNPVTLSSVTDLQEKAKLITDKRQAWQEVSCTYMYCNCIVLFCNLD